MKETIITILSFLSEHKVIVLSAAGTVAQLVVIMFNMIRKIHKIKAKKANERLIAMSYGPTKHTKPMNMKQLESLDKRDYTEALLWSMNPINLFRKP